MTKKSQLKQNLHALEDIANIMTAMKNLCSIQISKIIKFISIQEKVTDTFNKVRNDFLSAYPIIPSLETDPHNAVYILIGSERGFCGAFNESIAQKFAALTQHNSELNPALIIVGRKLALKFIDDNRVIQILDGTNVQEEIPAIISNVLQALEQISKQRHLQLHSVQWYVIFNEELENHIQVTTLQPFKDFFVSTSNGFSMPPILNLHPVDFLAELIDNYLFAMLHSIFYKSFLAENYQRLFQLNSSLDRLDNKKNWLAGKLKLLRQEEITEEIQIIMLSAEAIIGNTQS